MLANEQSEARIDPEIDWPEWRQRRKTDTRLPSRNFETLFHVCCPRKPNMRWCETSTPSSVKRDCLGVAETIAWGLLLFLFLFFTSLSSPFIFIIILNGGSRFLLFIFITLSGSEFVWGCFFAFIRTLHSLWSIVSTFRSRLVAIRTWHICQPTWQEVSNPSYLSFSRYRLKTTCFVFCSECTPCLWYLANDDCHLAVVVKVNRFRLPFLF